MNDTALDLPEIPERILHQVATGSNALPHNILGQHVVAAAGIADQITVVRVRRPLADRVIIVLETGARVELSHLYEGIWHGFHILGPQPYTVEARYRDGSVWTAEDPYRFSPTIGEFDLHLIGEGRHERLWEALGAHYRSHENVQGTSFSVWAPHAQAVRVTGDFLGWNGEGHALRNLGTTGVWEIFVPGLEPGALYKFELLSRDGQWISKADPMARATEAPPATASRVGISEHRWQDSAWMRHRASVDPHSQPLSIYELHLGSWRPGLGYRDLADPLIEYISELGFTHVEFLPLAEHPFGGSWGYQVTSYYAPTSRFGTADDLKYLIDRLHQAGIGIIMDWVPGHFPKDDFALARFDGEPLYEHPDWRRGEQMDWGTYVFDFGHSQVRNFLVANALFWLEEFHVDALRVDAVASMLYLDYSRKDGEWLPNQHGGREYIEAISFLQEVNATAYRLHPGIMMIAEESTSWPGVTQPTVSGGLGFGFKWNMGWMHDSLTYLGHDPLFRHYHLGELTFSFVYAFSENFILPISHDEVVHGKGSLIRKMPGDHWQQLANVRAYLAFMWAHPGKQLLFMGQEFGQYSEWDHDRGLDWWILDQPGHRGLWNLVGELNHIYRRTPALWELDHDQSGMEWIDGGAAAANVISFLRADRQGRPLAVIANFSGTAVHGYRVSLPHSGRWKELINTDAEKYGGSGVGNLGTVQAQSQPWAGRPASAEVSVPALGVLYLKPVD
ncbi:1,4-alpha-glucan branching protein GlgB [Rathayibacter toxicus]|uniref:1,4-alpha-glucan branching enzyme GlgB n=1 Tax=Rathayibacter toxicus TaxID=145458 RepID=A0A2S5Y720_9MICO|nr:1,4-alpha-glucan branching protein GlgB [Rathayibacter toxicus]PPH23724.1 1,4-alpha-glucan branching protein GlgB [Rathayibacter toxicus]PPH57532.1 1,4-alpha-glucan branching protein GlgB [Rathayibacter toxicus]PPH60029.1 1,4-alpha-glucan branching protein GlgB [Rathayibacter toxicus]PPI15254.1 1,4-alpha-glucan branching protein GlgB [Rathayibacter toxicus]PPI31575.1 1,4-alpha-glucan branching protein GlgB [Rathayibacter toxicus]